ncbi:hypothetical protein [Cryobacterium sinapicolor]|uniref:hypothetical protein n=1 Tax=Cryobacterium sinapicolor TaxID=1259236 RepID=UPI00141B5FDC|nr:hypothetical protein [Cryobacterium sinapicolor]
MWVRTPERLSVRMMTDSDRGSPIPGAARGTSVIGHRSSVIGHRSSVIGHRSSVIED